MGWCKLACLAWRFWLGALNIKGGRRQRNREEIGRIGSFARALRAFLRPSTLSRAPDKTAMLRRLGVSVSLAVKFVCLGLS